MKKIISIYLIFVLCSCGLQKQKNKLCKSKLYFIINRNTASSGEFLSCLAEYFFGKENVFVIGENSSGTMTNGDQFMYSLKNSKIILVLPCKRYINMVNMCTNSFYGEGKGIFPDYWSTDEDMEKTLQYLIEDFELK